MFHKQPRVPHPNVVLFDVRVGFQRRVKIGILLGVEDPAYSACFVIFSSTPTHIRVTNSDDPP
jgi:hypothetical protein